MKSRLLVFLMAALLIVAAMTTGCGGEKSAAPATPPQKVELNVSAAVSLKDALAEIQKNYEAKNSNIKLVYNLGASGALQKQIEQGAPADIFISAAPKQMNDLEEKNLVNKATRKNLVENKLVIIVPTASTLNITKYEDLTKDEVQKLSIGETASVPAGQYAQEVLKKLGIWDKIQNKAVLAKDVRTVLTYVETGNVEAGIVYKTDAASSDKVKIVATAPEGSHQPILYPIAILSGTKQQKAAEDFLTYLSTPECKAIFEKYGFTMSK
ncbi:molybdate ABC transporter substrate-binding protein [Pelosinus sp. IPA-1]|uniref:molybdate ABC transporter substrate-binding protein n=1 Tax=Pelosinus sp. IPA-1 TaxID=3029569 RepID=UPI0024361FDC|nr:molybdate ABC transporter substrate-binding protein [Pelosinus sp. IPA-1]GMB01620.1 molybdate ABC transporter substrate-binding protein [Pelosinus sp. IPA-1]